jgi:tetratricopeptide (TPR) repeat protein
VADVTGGPALDLGDIDDLDTRFKRRLAARIILVTLLSSVVAFLAADASAREDESAREAERNAVATMADDTRAYVDYFGGLAGYAEAQPFELRRWVSESRAQLLPDSYTRHAKQWQMAGDALANLSPLVEPGRYRDDPQRYLRDLFYQVDLASLRQSAQRETADAWGAKSERHTATLTVLGIVLSVLGLAATFGQRMWRLLVRPGVAVALGCLLFTAAVSLPRVAEVPEAALRQVADGNRLVRARDYKAAIRAYSSAIERQPGYATAYIRRAMAYALDGSPEQDQSYVFSISDPQARARSIDDLEHAFRLGAYDDLLAVITQGANYFFAKRYGLAEKLTRHAIELNPHLPVPRLTLGLALAAQGKVEEAARTYQTAADLAAQRPGRAERQELFAVAHTTLEQLARQSPERADLVRRFQSQLTAAETTARFGPLRKLPPEASISHLAASVDAGTLTARYDYRAIPENAALSWIVYTRPDDKNPWWQRPGLNRFEQFQATPASTGAGTRRVDIPEGPCPTAGDYRIDLYLEGNYIGSSKATRPPSADPLVPDRDSLRGFSLCRPEQWTVRRQPGRLDMKSAASRQSMSVSAFPAPPEMTGAGAKLELGTVMDQLAAREGFRPSTQRLGDLPVGDMDGKRRAYGRPGQPDRRLEVWASLGPDAILRTVVAEGPADDFGLFGRLLARIVFQPLDG